MGSSTQKLRVHGKTKMKPTRQAAVQEHRAVEPWISYLEDEMAGAKADDPVSYCLAQILRDTLLHTGKPHAVAAAQRIDTYYRYEFLSSDSLLMSLEGNGTAGFLCKLYHLIFCVARFITCGPPQEVLVQLLVELRKLPPTSCRLWNVCYSLPHCRPGSRTN